MQRFSGLESLENRTLFAFNYALAPITASVGNGGVNRTADVRIVQQRLKNLGFGGTDGSPLVVDGSFGGNTGHAIALFQAVIDSSGESDIGLEDGRIDFQGTTHQWLAASNAPGWKEIIDTDGAGGAFDIFRGSLQTERWGSTWAVNTAVTAFGISSGTQIVTGISTKNGSGSSAFHATHQAGMDVDVNIADRTPRASGALDAGETQILNDMLSFYRNPQGGSRVWRIFLNQPRVRAEFNRLTATTSIATIDTSGVHDSHLHFDFRPPAAPISPALRPAGPIIETASLITQTPTTSSRLDSLFADETPIV